MFPLILLFLIQVLSSSKASNNNGNGSYKKIQSPYEYTPITALNQYGQSTQLRHAQLASSRYGSLTLIAIANADVSSDSQLANYENHAKKVIVCCTFPNPTSPGIKRSITTTGTTGTTGTTTTTAANNTTTFSPPSLVQILAHDDSGRIPRTITAMVGSGMKPDLQFLAEALRDYARRIWERYDVIPSTSRISQAVSQVCLSFMGYDLDDEIMDGVGPVLVANGQDNGDDEEPMARPLGIQVLILGIHDHDRSLSNKGDSNGAEAVQNKGRSSSGAEMISVDASGNQIPCHVFAMGKDGDAARALLKERWTNDMNVREVKEMMVQIIQELKFDEDSIDKQNVVSGLGNVDEEIIIPFEILSRDGITLSETWIKRRK